MAQATYVYPRLQTCCTPHRTSCDIWLTITLVRGWWPMRRRVGPITVWLRLINATVFVIKNSRSWCRHANLPQQLASGRAGVEMGSRGSRRWLLLLCRKWNRITYRYVLYANRQALGIWRDLLNRLRPSPDRRQDCWIFS